MHSHEEAHELVCISLLNSKEAPIKLSFSLIPVFAIWISQAAVHKEWMTDFGAIIIWSWSTRNVQMQSTVSKMSVLHTMTMMEILCFIIMHMSGT